MIQEDDLFDDFLRKKEKEVNIQFEENDWIMAKELVYKNRMNSKNIKRFVLFFFVLLFSVISYNYMMKINAKNSENITSKIYTHSTNTKVNKIPENINIESNPINHPKINKATQLIVNLDKEKMDSNNIKETKKEDRKKYKKYKLANHKIKNNTRKKGEADFYEPNTISIFEKINLLKEQEENYFLLENKPLSKLNMLLALCDTCIKQNDYQLIKKYKQLAQQKIWLEAGLTYYNPANLAYQNFSYYAGIKYQYFLSSKTFLSGGVYFTGVNQNQKERIINEKNYGFGLNEITKNLQTTHLDYLEVPITIGYFLSAKHSIQLGVSFLYVLQSYETLKTIQTIEMNKEKTNYLNGYRNHINEIDMQIAISHQYYLLNNWHMNSSFYYGLTKVSVNDNNNIGFRLGAAYKF